MDGKGKIVIVQWSVPEGQIFRPLKRRCTQGSPDGCIFAMAATIVSPPDPPDNFPTSLPTGRAHPVSCPASSCLACCLQCVGEHGRASEHEVGQRSPLVSGPGWSLLWGCHLLSGLCGVHTMVCDPLCSTPLPPHLLWWRVLWEPCSHSEELNYILDI